LNSLEKSCAARETCASGAADYKFFSDGGDGRKNGWLSICFADLRRIVVFQTPDFQSSSETDFPNVHSSTRFCLFNFRAILRA